MGRLSNSLSTPAAVGGLVGTGLSLATGLPGLGLVGTAIGTGLDVTTTNDIAETMGIGRPATFGPAMMSNVPFGNIGMTPTQQATRAFSNFTAPMTMEDAKFAVDTTLNNLNTAPLSTEDAEAAVGPGSVGPGGHAPGATTAGMGTEGNSGVDSAGASSTVICTELHRQGLMPRHVYLADAEFGRRLLMNDPLVMAGYHWWASPIASAMARSRLLTAVVRVLAMPWAREIAARHGDSLFGSMVGKLYLRFGIPACRWLGRLRMRGRRAYA